MPTLFSFKILLGAFLLGAFTDIQADGLFKSSAITDIEITGRIDTTFDVSDNLLIDLENLFGNIDISTWSQPKVAVKVRIRARDKDESDAYKIMEGIEVDLIKTGNTLRISTQINQNRSTVGKVISKANPFNKGSVDIDYTLLVPESTEFNIDNRFGDITIRDLKQKIYIELAHGDLRMDQVEKGSRLELSFSKVDIEELDDAVIVLRDSRMDLKLARNLDLDSRSSEVRIDQILDLKIESKRDEIFIRSVEELTGTSQFTKYEIELLKSVCDINMAFGSLDIERVSPLFKSMRIEQRNVNVEINIKELNFDIQAILEGGLFVVPPDLQNLNVEVTDEKKKIRTISGHIGKESLQRIILKGNGGEFVIFR